jgi:hypothetical protein
MKSLHDKIWRHLFHDSNALTHKIDREIEFQTTDNINYLIQETLVYDYGSSNPMIDFRRNIANKVKYEIAK